MRTALRRLGSAVALVGVATHGVCHASEWPWPIGGSLTWTSDYVLRGVSQSANLPALQADLHVQPTSHWSVGAWASMVHLVPHTNAIEFNFYIDGHWQLDPDVTLSLTAAHYAYDNDPRGVPYYYDELRLAGSWRDTLYLSAAWSPNVFLLSFPGGLQTNQQTLAVEVNYHRPLPWRLDGWAGVGYYVPLEQTIGNYSYGSAGVARQLGAVRAELNYFWVNNRYHRPFTPGPAGGPWAFSATWRF